MATLITQKTVKFLGIAGIVVLIAAGGVLVVQPLITQVQSQASEIQSAEDQIDTMTTSRDQLKDSKTNYNIVKATNDELLLQFPELAQVPELLDTITAGAVGTGIPASDLSSLTFSAPAITVPTVAAVAPAAEAAPAEEAAEAADAAAAPAPADTVVSAGDYAEMEVGIAIKGSPTQIQEFLTYLNTMDRVMIISAFSVDVAKDAETGQSDATLAITGTTFIYKSILTPDQIIAQSDAAATVTEDTATDVVPSGGTEVTP